MVCSDGIKFLYRDTLLVAHFQLRLSTRLVFAEASLQADEWGCFRVRVRVFLSFWS